MTSGLPQLSPQLCQQLLAAAQESHPREACGLLTCGADRELAWVQVQNRAKGDQEFEMAAEDWVRCVCGWFPFGVLRCGNLWWSRMQWGESDHMRRSPQTSPSGPAQYF